MAQFDFIPNVGIGKLTFGMSRAQVNAALGDASSVEAPRPPGAFSCTYYPEQTLWVEFDASGQACSFELGSGAAVVWSGVELTRMSLARIIEHLRSRGYEPDVSKHGFRCNEVGISSRAESGLRHTPDRIFVYQTGYFDKPINVDFEAVLQEIKRKQEAKK